jgi:uncharacterized protein YheU (UPF0270 family)
MAQFVQVPVSRLAADTLQSLLEEYASRDGTDYGERECSLAEKVDQLKLQLERDELVLVYDQDSEEWDLLPAKDAGLLEL